MTEEQRHALEWAVAHCGLNGIHRAPLLELLANSQIIWDSASEAFEQWNEEQSLFDFDDDEAENHARCLFKAGYLRANKLPQPKMVRPHAKNGALAVVGFDDEAACAAFIDAALSQASKGNGND